MKKDGKSTMPNSTKVVDRVHLKTLNGDMDEIDRVLTHWALEIIESHRRTEEDLARTLEKLSSAITTNGTEKLLIDIPDRLWIGGDLYALSMVKIDSSYYVFYVKRSNPKSILFRCHSENFNAALSKLMSKLKECENEGFLQHNGNAIVFDEKEYTKSLEHKDDNCKKAIKDYNDL